MILSYGTETVRRVPREARPLSLLRATPTTTAATPSSASTASLSLLVNAFKSAAKGYGIEKRVLLVARPGGQQQEHDRPAAEKGARALLGHAMTGHLYTLGWVDLEAATIQWCPMNEEPLHLVPERFRADVAAQLNAGRGPTTTRSQINGELCPFCRYVYTDG